MIDEPVFETDVVASTAMYDGSGPTGSGTLPVSVQVPDVGHVGGVQLNRSAKPWNEFGADGVSGFSGGQFFVLKNVTVPGPTTAFASPMTNAP